MNKNYFSQEEIIFFQLIISNTSVTTEQRIQRKIPTLGMILLCGLTKLNGAWSRFWAGICSDFWRIEAIPPLMCTNKLQQRKVHNKQGMKIENKQKGYWRISAVPLKFANMGAL